MAFFSAQADIAVTTYQEGKLFLLRRGADGKLSKVVRDFQRCMGMPASFDGLGARHVMTTNTVSPSSRVGAMLVTLQMGSFPKSAFLGGSSKADKMSPP